ncbi:MAG: zf-HC2 domain-containing protein [Acidobacteria bacterium]|nr:zf-HC2 domain-containing protein [Acidobacteriota bacterium]
MTHVSGRHGEDCRELFAHLSEYLDEELTPEARREMEEHLCGCQPCAEFLGSLRRTIDLCRECEPGGLPQPLSREAKQQLLAAFQRMLTTRRGPTSL